MRTNQGFAGIKILLAVLFVSLLVAGSVRAHGGLPVYHGKFSLPFQVHWGKSVLQPGDYTITIQSTGTPAIAFISKADGNGGTRVVTAVHSEQTNGVNALLLRDKDGHLTVHSLSLADLGMVLIYDPSLAREPVQEARDSRTIPVMSARM